MTTTTEQQRPHGGITFSREVRLGEIIAAVAIIGSFFGVYTGLRDDVASVKTEQRVQAVAADGLRKEFREVSQRLSIEMKDQGQTIRRIESRMDRARM